MTLGRIFKTIFLVEFVKGLLMAIKEMFKNNGFSILKEKKMLYMGQNY